MEIAYVTILGALALFSGVTAIQSYEAEEYASFSVRTIIMVFLFIIIWYPFV